jgi:dolichyl-phosphate beta-glucosyltransferase
MSSLNLSVVIPAYNEAGTLSGHLDRLVPLLQSVCANSWEIVIVDDGSHDETAAVVVAYGHPAVRVLSLEVNQGKGAALCVGMRETFGDRVLMCDADMSTSPDHLIEFMAAMDAGADIVIGNRRSPAARIVRRQSLPRRTLGRFYIYFATALLGVHVQDINCGFKLFRGAVARELFAASQTARWAIDIEILARAAKKSYRVVEVPVVWCDADKSNVSMLRDVCTTFLHVLQLYFKLR